jgi:hypothetical protein
MRESDHTRSAPANTSGCRPRGTADDECDLALPPGGLASEPSGKLLGVQFLPTAVERHLQAARPQNPPDVARLPGHDVKIAPDL